MAIDRYFLSFLCMLLIFSGLFEMQAHQPKVQLGIDSLFSTDYAPLLKEKKIGLITNQTGIDSQGRSTIELFKENEKRFHYKLQALFAPEHGLTGLQRAGETIFNQKSSNELIIYSLHGATRRPTSEMLQDINLLVFDIQDIGSRSYTYCSTLFYAMEEAAKREISVIVLDRPNPLGGLLIDGPMLEDKWRSFVGYINVPYCHGLTIGELALYFNGEYQIGCNLTVIPLKGWQRQMLFQDTGLIWIPTSPQIPEMTTPFFYPTTGLLGELQLVNIGIGYPLPFKVIGAPWIDANEFAQQLNNQNYPGVHFFPFHYRPFFGRFKEQDCHGVLIAITNPSIFLPITTQYLLMGTLKNLYPTHFEEAFQKASNLQLFYQVCGTEQIYAILANEKYVTWKLRSLHEKERALYLKKRKNYLIADYQQ